MLNRLLFSPEEAEVRDDLSKAIRERRKAIKKIQELRGELRGKYIALATTFDQSKKAPIEERIADLHSEIDGYRVMKEELERGIAVLIREKRRARLESKVRVLKSKLSRAERDGKEEEVKKLQKEIATLGDKMVKLLSV